MVRRLACSRHCEAIFIGSTPDGHTFELTNIAGTATAGVMKDVVMLVGHQEIAVDFVANDPGLRSVVEFA